MAASSTLASALATGSFAGTGAGPAASFATALSRAALSEASAYRWFQSGGGGKLIATLAACGACAAFWGFSPINAALLRSWGFLRRFRRIVDHGPLVIPPRPDFWRRGQMRRSEVVAENWTAC